MDKTYIVFLGEAEELADLGGTLGAETLGVDDVGETGELLLALLDNGQSEDGEVHGDNAAADGLTLALTGAAGTVAGVTVRKQEADTGRVHDTLLHGETLLVVASSDPEDVSLPLVTEGVGGDLSAHLKYPSVSINPIVDSLWCGGRFGFIVMTVLGRCIDLDNSHWLGRGKNVRASP